MVHRATERALVATFLDTLRDRRARLLLCGERCGPCGLSLDVKQNMSITEATDSEAYCMISCTATDTIDVTRTSPLTPRSSLRSFSRVLVFLLVWTTPTALRWTLLFPARVRCACRPTSLSPATRALPAIGRAWSTTRSCCRAASQAQ